MRGRRLTWGARASSEGQEGCSRNAWYKYPRSQGDQSKEGGRKDTGGVGRSSNNKKKKEDKPDAMRELTTHLDERDEALMLIQCSGFIFVRSQPDIFRSFGFKEEPVIIAILLFQADAFAVKMGYAPKLRSGLIKMQEENLSAMNTDPWYSAYHCPSCHSHPLISPPSPCHVPLCGVSPCPTGGEPIIYEHGPLEENLSAMNTDPWYSAYHHSHPCLPERLATIDAEAKRLGKKEE
ncbi:unnamed protein product [Closterium sp. Naga37s-1]|nr:unnamed protein product [Closterium sp. Naga37s-1]